VAGGFPPAAFREEMVRSAMEWMRFWKDDQGQDLIEYSLLLSFVCLAGAAMFISMGTMTGSLWSIVNSRLGASNQSS
jgi:Flp pilus assembly pilin Flp